MPHAANKDEAAKCLQLSRRFLEQGETILALKYAEKAARLDGSSGNQQWLDQIQKQKEQVKEDDQEADTAEGAEREAFREEQRKPKEQRATSASLGEIQNLLKKKNYYQVLDVQRSATEAEIKKAYRKLALLYHPDKSKTAGAEEAFKLVSKAFSCLNDPDKRRQNDMTGGQEGMSFRNHPFAFNGNM